MGVIPRQFLFSSGVWLRRPIFCVPACLFLFYVQGHYAFEHINVLLGAHKNCKKRPQIKQDIVINDFFVYLPIVSNIIAITMSRFLKLACILFAVLFTTQLWAPVPFCTMTASVVSNLTFTTQQVGYNGNIIIGPNDPGALIVSITPTNSVCNYKSILPFVAPVNGYMALASNPVNSILVDSFTYGGETNYGTVGVPVIVKIGATAHVTSASQIAGVYTLNGLSLSVWSGGVQPSY